MKDFFKKTWVKVGAWVMVIVGSLVLILGGTAIADIGKIPTLVFAIVEAVGILIAFVASLVKSKTEKTE
jgi:hypothetical protein